MYIYSKPAHSRHQQRGQLVISSRLGEPARTAKQIYASQTKVKELTDANLWNIFYDRNKVVVVYFWADSCRTCDGVAAVMTSLADRYSKGPLARLVKFYHVQWDPKVNPKVHQRFGFKSVPVVFFYYTSTGRPPTRDAPLLEGSLGGEKTQFDPNQYIRRIEASLRKHGHIAPAQGVPVSAQRGWTTTRDLLTKEDLIHIDQMLIEPSPFQRYFIDLYRANPGTRFSKVTQILAKSSFDLQYQKINGSLPGSNVAGTLDKRNGRAYLLAVNAWLQVYLGRAVHEAIHLFSCPIQGPYTRFYQMYGFGITEGFTQYVTEQILRSQKLTIVQPSPYRDELAAVTKLAEVVGVSSLADDYFLCTRKVYEQLSRSGTFSRVWALSRNAVQQSSESARKEAYATLIRFLESIKPSK